MKLLLLSLLLLLGCQEAKYPKPRILLDVPDYPLLEVSNLDQYLIQRNATKWGERFTCIYLSESGNVLDVEEIGAGSRDEVTFSAFGIAQQATKLKAKAVIVSHNHLARYFAQPSSKDLLTTEELRQYLALYGIELKAHVVVTDHDSSWIH